MIKLHWIAALVLSGIVATAQTGSQTAYRGQSWVGLLVSASCDKGSSQAGDRGKSNRESDLTTSGRTTTPAVDAAGTRGSANTADADTATQNQKQTTPEIGDALARDKSSTDPGWGPAHKQAQSLGAACSIKADTTEFALVLADGKILHFDELANQAIVKQLPSRPMGAKERKMLLRVSVQGKLQNGKIALDSIRM